MFNNFDYLFLLPKNLQEIVNKRQSHVQKYGKEVFMGILIQIIFSDFFFVNFLFCFKINNIVKD